MPLLRLHTTFRLLRLTCNILYTARIIYQLFSYIHTPLTHTYCVSVPLHLKHGKYKPHTYSRGARHNERLRVSRARNNGISITSTPDSYAQGRRRRRARLKGLNTSERSGAFRARRSRSLSLSLVSSSATVLPR